MDILFLIVVFLAGLFFILWLRSGFKRASLKLDIDGYKREAEHLREMIDIYKEYVDEN